MAGKVRERLTFANVVSVISLLLALGLGSAWAATELSKNEVKSRHIKNREVRTKDLANDAVTSPKVLNGSLLSEDFAANQIPAGPAGPQGEQGVPGQDATKLFAYIRDNGPADHATVQYGSGVTAVSDVDVNTQYVVTFNRSLVNCVVLAVPGRGDPTGTFSSQHAGPHVAIEGGAAGQVRVEFENDTGAGAETAFMIAAFC